MKKKFSIGLVLSALLWSGGQTYAIPAVSTSFALRQSDGTSLTVRLCGDEHHHYYLSETDEVLLPDTQGDLHPADPATARSLRVAVATRPGVTYRRSSITLGRQKVLVILAQYPDCPFMSEDPKTAFERMMNEPGYAERGAVGSARDYFVQNSAGRYEPDITVYGPVTLPQEMSYYGAPDGTKPDSRPAELIRDACALADGEIDFSEYDLDGDGWIDNVYVFYAGYGQAHGGSPDTMWPQGGYAWQGSQLEARFDGVQLDRYACSNEVDLQRQLMGIGTFCHEFCHSLGLPDLYPTLTTHDAHPDTWSLMANGGTNNGGHTPPNLSAYERYALGWIEPKTVDCADTLFRLPDITHNEAYLIRTDDKNEYFLLENRQQKGWDSYLPGHGLLVWHIDFDQRQWSKNTPNDDPEHQHIDIEEADGDTSPSTRGGDAFPGTWGRHTLTDDTQPSLLAWDGSRRDLGLYHIDETADSLIVFNVVSTTSQLPQAVTREASDISPVSFQANWEAVEGAADYVLEVYQPGNGVKTPLPGWRLRHVGKVTSALVEGLDPATDYSYAVRAVGAYVGEWSDERAVRTLDKDFRFFAPVLLEEEEITGNSFTARWEAMDEATEYFLSAGLVTPGESHALTQDFTEGLDRLEGWSTNCTGLYTFAGYYGKAAPSLNMDKNGSFLRSPLLEEDEVSSVTFWYRGFSSQEGNCLTVSGYRNGTWQVLATIDPISTDKEGATFRHDISMYDEPCRAIRIAYERGQRGNVAIDDVEVVYDRYEYTPLPDYTDRPAGNALSMKVENLYGGGLYRYKVKASNGTLFSQYSTERTVSIPCVDRVDRPQLQPLIYSADGTLCLTNPHALPLAAEVYTLSGIRLHSVSLQAGETVQLALPAHTLYLIQADGRMYKAMILP